MSSTFTKNFFTFAEEVAKIRYSPYNSNNGIFELEKLYYQLILDTTHSKELQQEASEYFANKLISER